MTLDEAIKHYEEMAEVSECASKMLSHDAFLHSDQEYRDECRRNAIVSAKTSKEHRQLAEWLTELKQWRRVHGICPSYEMCIPECKEGYNAQIGELEAKHWDECRQIAHYDDELKEATLQAIRNNARTVLANMDNLDLHDENRELKRLLKAAMADLRESEDCSCCIFDSKQCPGVTGDCTFKWKHYDEAIELMGGENI